MEANRKLEVITNSECKAKRTCSRLHYYKYILGYRVIFKALPLIFGTAFHAALEIWWRTAGNLSKALEAFAGVELDKYDLIRAEELLRGYHFRWGDEEITVLGVELQFTAPIVHPETGEQLETSLGGKVDAVAKVGKHVLLPEHKTSSEDVSPGSNYWRVLLADAQISTYLYGAQFLGFDARGVLYDVIWKGDMKPKLATPEDKKRFTKKGELYANQREADEPLEEFRLRFREHIAENPERYYRREEIVRLSNDMDEAALDLWDTASDIEYTRNHPDERTTRSPEACRNYGRLCDFFGVCWEGEDLKTSTRFEKVDRIHTELD